MHKHRRERRSPRTPLKCLLVFCAGTGLWAAVQNGQPEALSAAQRAAHSLPDVEPTGTVPKPSTAPLARDEDTPDKTAARAVRPQAETKRAHPAETVPGMARSRTSRRRARTNRRAHGDGWGEGIKDTLKKFFPVPLPPGVSKLFPFTAGPHVTPPMPGLPTLPLPPLPTTPSTGSGFGELPPRPIADP